jgi:hypothetical protein
MLKIRVTSPIPNVFRNQVETVDRNPQIDFDCITSQTDIYTVTKPKPKQFFSALYVPTSKSGQKCGIFLGTPTFQIT